VAVKVYLIQKDVNNRDLASFLDRASASGADVVCFGELATSGCLYEPREIEPLEHWLELFGKYDLHIMVGLPQQHGRSLVNTYIYYHAGEVQTYEKINLFPPMNENRVYRPGTEPGVFDTTFGRIGVAICYDIRFVGVFDALRVENISRLIIPAAFPRVRIDDWRRLLVERAKQIGVPVFGINAVGDDGTNEFGGSSMVVTADGEIVEQADETEETVLKIEI
jgi:omega-amidase